MVLDSGGGVVFGRLLLGYESGALKNEISAPIKENPSSLTSYVEWGNSEKTRPASRCEPLCVHLSNIYKLMFSIKLGTF